jgi:hypothetical protein
MVVMRQTFCSFAGLEYRAASLQRRVCHFCSSGRYVLTAARVCVCARARAAGSEAGAVTSLSSSRAKSEQGRDFSAGSHLERHLHSGRSCVCVCVSVRVSLCKSECACLSTLHTPQVVMLLVLLNTGKNRRLVTVEHVGRHSYWLTRVLLLRAMALCYLAGFSTSAFQARALFGSLGLQPADFGVRPGQTHVCI